MEGNNTNAKNSAMGGKKMEYNVCLQSLQTVHQLKA